MSKKTEIADLIKKVSIEVSFERGAICAHDLLLQWEAGQLKETMKVWEQYIIEYKNKSCHTSCNRHGAWVPAIPMK